MRHAGAARAARAARGHARTGRRRVARQPFRHRRAPRRRASRGAAGAAPAAPWYSPLSLAHWILFCSTRDMGLPANADACSAVLLVMAPTCHRAHACVAALAHERESVSAPRHAKHPRRPQGHLHRGGGSLKYARGVAVRGRVARPRPRRGGPQWRQAATRAAWLRLVARGLPTHFLPSACPDARGPTGLRGNGWGAGGRVGPGAAVGGRGRRPRVRPCVRACTRPRAGRCIAPWLPLAPPRGRSSRPGGSHGG